MDEQAYDNFREKLQELRESAPKRLKENVVTDLLQVYPAWSRAYVEALYDELFITQEALAAKPVAWIIPGCDEERPDGFIDCRVDQDGEFTRPLYGDPSEVIHMREALSQVTRERDEARGLVAEANNSLFGSHAYFHSMDGGPYDKLHLSRAIERLKEASAGKPRDYAACTMGVGCEMYGVCYADARGLSMRCGTPSSEEPSDV